MSNAPGPLTVSFHRLAAQEYRRARNWYARRSPSVAQRFQQAVDDVVQRIASGPGQGTPFRGRFRWLRVRRFPYLLYYDEISPDEVMVLAVAHAQRRPGYWLRRAP